MTEDQLAEISGIKPKALLKDGEEKEVSSMTSNSVYKVKRTMDHYYCTCPAWRNQSKFPINARTCKHLKALLGDAYEEARLKLMNPGASGTSSKKSSTKPDKGSKRKRGAEDGEDKTKGKKKTRTSKPPSKNVKEEGGNEDENSESEEEEAGASSGEKKKKVPELLLAVKWDVETGVDPTGWWISEKPDGVRTYFDGSGFVSRLGNPFTAPTWFFENLPKEVTLDGERFGGRGKFSETVSIVKTANSPRWKGMTFQV
jgi:DNA ligase-1